MRFRVARFKYWPLLVILLLIVSATQSYVLLNKNQDQCPDVYTPEQDVWNAVLESNNNMRMKILQKEAIIGVMELERTQECLEEGKIELSGEEIPHPKLRLNTSQLQLENNYVRFDITGVEVGVVANTNSMDPTLDEDNLVLEVMPENPEEIQAGDIIIYELNGERIIHRVVEVGVDDDAWYVIGRGDNNALADPEKIRWEQIRGVVIGIIY